MDHATIFQIHHSYILDMYDLIICLKCILHKILLDFLRYVSENINTYMLVTALTVMLTSASAAYRCIDNVMGEMRGARRFSGFFGLLFSFVFSLLFLATVYVAALLMLTGRWFLDMAGQYISFINISESWGWFRFVLLFALLFLILSGIYRLTAPHGVAVRFLPGALAATLALVAASAVFSEMIGANSKYPVVYGSLASVIVLMLWLYVCMGIVFLGAVLNRTLFPIYSQKGLDKL